MAEKRKPEFTADTRPLLDRIGPRNVNIGLFVIYLLLWGWGVATLLFIPIHPNTDWPIAQSLAYSIGITLIHFGLIVTGATLVPNYIYYPVKPILLYILADMVIFFAFAAVVASYILNSLASTMPLFGTWAMVVALSVHLWKLYELVWGSARAKGDTLLASGV